MTAIPIKIKLDTQKASKVLNMKSILVAALALLKAHFFKDIKMPIEYHLLKPSIGVFLWTVITQSLGPIQKNKDTFNYIRDEFYKEYVLPIGQSLGYDGVDRTRHFDKDFYSPYYITNDERIYPHIKGKRDAPLEEIKRAFHTLTLMEKKLLTASKIIPTRYKQLLKKK